MARMSADAERKAFRPRDAADAAELLREHRGALEPIGRGSKRLIGGMVEADLLDLSALAGIVDYEPAELVLSAHAATPLEAIEDELDRHGQRLAFEPPAFDTLLGIESRGQTLGGVLATNLAGSRRIAAGAARDHFLGFEAVSGDGVAFKAGGRVVKNVTGYDLPKLLAGSWGTLAVLTRVTVRVAPRPESERTLIVPAAGPAEAVELMTAALSSPYEVSGAAFLPGRGVALRVEGFAASVASRAGSLRGALALPEPETLADRLSGELWARIGGAAALSDAGTVLRISVPPSEAPRVVAALEPERYLLDWGGGLLWAALGDADLQRARAAVPSGRVILWKAPNEARARAEVFPPQPPPLAAITARLKGALDPSGRLSPGRMGEMTAASAPGADPRGPDQVHPADGSGRPS